MIHSETRDNLWTLIAAPTIWALHFLVSYIVAAAACVPNVAIFQAIAGPRILIAVITAIALVAIGLIFWRARREWKGHGGGSVHDTDTATGRERFLEFSTLLLAALSFVSVVFVALPALFVADCR
ncbi:hypothetical protein [Jiella marina]|uniref:hypothetical protein n=1 Tax=Jiella sp. LLJ827 TaxID=2917712 RepID=UPI002100A348|nr:hypothetical protein [Jiella sp. LLJ827]MCQ0988375.1 hypothetical protein [Jiella sp. LLJ827]